MGRYGWLGGLVGWMDGEIWMVGWMDSEIRY